MISSYVVVLDMAFQHLNLISTWIPMLLLPSRICYVIMLFSSVTIYLNLDILRCDYHNST